MSNKIALICGGTSGVGLSLVKALAQRHYHVYFIGTNLQQGEKLEKELQSQSKGSIHFIPLDLSKPDEVKLFIDSFLRKQERLDLLAHTAGVIQPEREVTADGLEKTFTVGYLSAFALASGFIPLLQEGTQPRILNVGAAPSTILKPGLNFDDLHFTKNYNGFKASVAAVHAKTVLTQILAEKLSNKKIDVNSFHPGMVRSNLSRHLPLPMRLAGKALSPFMAGASESGIYVSTAQEISGMSGRLFVGKKGHLLNFERAYREKLWNVSEELIEAVTHRKEAAEKREPNFKLGWISPKRLAGLTHFHPEITQDDMMGVYHGASELLKGADQEFHMIIDNRMAPLNALFTLQELQAMSPFLQHPLLKYLVVVKPLHLTLNEEQAQIQEANGVLLKNVSGIEEGMNFLKKNQALSGITAPDPQFFPNTSSLSYA